jgi:hypothetical protein
MQSKTRVFAHCKNLAITAGIIVSSMWVPQQIYAQHYLHYDNLGLTPIDKVVNQPGKRFHTSLKQYRYNEIQAIANVDSLLYDGIKIPQGKQNIFKRFLNDDLLRWKTPDYRVVINPLFNFEVGKENQEGINTFVNTRGLFIEGSLGKNFSFYADVLENQGSFPNYIEAFADHREVIPGQGRTKRLNYDSKSRVHDYAQSSGYISFNPGKYFNLQLGQGKNFIGDGYRSLLLSDVASNYPYFKFTTTFGNVKYMIMWASMSHMERDETLGDVRYPVKYGVFHYLNWNLGNRLSIGLFENVIWAAQHESTGYRGFDMAYLNPFIFFRPVEYSVGSPDNVNLGFNIKYIAAKWLTLYGQVILDEFKADEVFSGSKWWANKQGFQGGFKTFDLFGVRNLNLQAEYNQVRPYTYTHYQPIINYGHLNQELAHPLGANFKEMLSILSYRHKRWTARVEFVSARYGKDSESINYGHDIFLPSDDRPSDYGHTLGQGVKTTLNIADASLTFLVNPRNQFNLSAGVRYREEKNAMETLKTAFVYLGIRTSLKSLYYDF